MNKFIESVLTFGKEHKREIIIIGGITGGVILAFISGEFYRIS